MPPAATAAGPRAWRPAGATAHILWCAGFIVIVLGDAVFARAIFRLAVRLDPAYFVLDAVGHIVLSAVSLGLFAAAVFLAKGVKSLGHRFTAIGIMVFVLLVGAVLRRLPGLRFEPLFSGFGRFPVDYFIPLALIVSGSLIAWCVLRGFPWWLGTGAAALGIVGAAGYALAARAMLGAITTLSLPVPVVEVMMVLGVQNTLLVIPLLGVLVYVIIHLVMSGIGGAAVRRRRS